MQNKIIFDFDETLISVNSFPLWIRFLLFQSTASLNLSILLKVIWLIFRRKIIRNLAHDDFKLRLILTNAPPGWDKIFSKKLLKHSRPELIKKISTHLDFGDHVAISSAAPYQYLSKSIEMLLPGRSDEVLILGATVESGILNENYKEKKLFNIYKCGFIGAAETISVLYTDSWDDRFLAAVSETVCLVTPLRSELELFKKDPLLKNKTSIFQ